MQKKQFVKTVIIANIIILFGYLLFQAIQSSLNKKRQVQAIAVLKPITVYQQNHPIIINKEFFTTDYLLLAYMSTDCDHCDYMTDQLCKNINRFVKCRVVLLAQGSPTSLGTFSKKHQLDSCNNILLLHDKNMEVLKKYKISSTPYFLMYNKEGKNILAIKGETKIDNLLKPLQ